VSSHAGEGARAAGQRGEREDDQSGHEHSPAAVQVGQPPVQQQQAAEGEAVGVDDPRQAVAREVRRNADRRQRDVRDRHVDRDHELGADDQQQHPPATGRGSERLLPVILDGGCFG
jgi:hypothetical protein